MKRILLVTVNYLSGNGKEYFNKKVNSNFRGLNTSGSMKDQLINYFSKNVRSKDYELFEEKDCFRIVAKMNISLFEKPVYNIFLKNLKGLAKGTINVDYDLEVLESGGW